MFGEAGHRCTSLPPVTRSRLSFAKAAAGGTTSLLPPVVLQQDSTLRQSDEAHSAMRPRIQRSTSGQSERCPTAAKEIHDVDRSSSSRLRAVTSMRSLLPLYLANPETPLDARPSHQLRRTNSDPTTPGQLIRDSPNQNDSAKPMSAPPCSLPARSQPPISTQPTQALFDIGIFRPSTSSSGSARATVSDEDAADGFSQYSPPASASDEALASDFFGALTLAKPRRNSRVRFDAPCHAAEGGCHGPSSMKSSGNPVDEALFTAAARNSFAGSRTSRVIESEAEWLKGDLEETSWLLDASDDEGQSDNVWSNASTEESKWELDSVGSTKAESSLDSPSGSVIEYATVLSPSRATLVDVSSQRSSTCSMDARTTSPTTTDITVPGESCPSLGVPVTPPSSPYRTFLDCDSRRKSAKAPTIEASSATQLPKEQMSMTPPQTPEDSATRSCPRHAGLGTITSMLEQAVAEFPSTMLGIESPVVSCIRIYKESAAVVDSARLSGSDSEIAYSAARSVWDAPCAQQRMDPGTGTADLSWFREILGASKDTIPRGIYAHILALSFLHDFLQGKLVSRHCTKTPPSSSSSTQPIQCAFDEQLDKAQLLRQGLQLCLRRLVESVVGVAAGNEVLLRSLTAVVRLAEDSAAGARENDECVGTNR